MSEFSSLPSVRLDELQCGSCISEMVDQISELGVVLVSHIPLLKESREEVFKALRQFTFLPEFIKEQYIVPESNYSIGWSRGVERLEDGQPDRNKGSFYFNLTPVNDFSLLHSKGEMVHGLENVWPKEVPLLKSSLEKMNKIMVHAATSLIQTFDKYLAAHVEDFPSGTLTKILTNSHTHKGRCLVYYPVKSPQSSEKWCGEHFDHGLLTGLTAPVYFDQDNNQVHCPDEKCGLYIRNRSGQIQRVSCPEDCLLFQLGECAQILSGGILKATSHWVSPPATQTEVYRSTLAVFFNPSTDVVLQSPGDLPSGISRLIPGETFGDFSGKTYQLYY